MRTHARTVTKTAILLSVALIIGLIENALPPILPQLPFAKLGLSNVAVLLSVFFVGIPYSYVVVVSKCFLLSLIQGNFSAMLYSVPAGLLSLSIMILLLTTKKFSIPAVSVVGALTHNTTQIAVATLIVGNGDLWFLLAYLAGFGMLAGFLTGCLTYVLIKKLPFK